MGKSAIRLKTIESTVRATAESNRSKSITLKFIFLLAATLLSLIFNSAQAQVVSVRGMASYEYSGRLNANHERAARNDAKLAALDMYFASESTPAMSRIYAAEKEFFVSRVNDFIISVTEISADNNRSSRTFTVVVRADINVPVLRAAIDNFGATTNIAANERSLITLLFVSRMQASVQSFDDRVYTRADTDNSTNLASSNTQSSNEQESITSQSVQLSDSSNMTMNSTDSTSMTTTTGGSVTRQADRVQWRVASSQEINIAMSSVFSSAGYEVVEAQYLESSSNGLLSVSRVSEEFSTGNDLSAQVMQSTVDGIKAAEIPFMGIGTLDVGVPGTDPVSGLTRVYVTVTGRVMDVSGRFPRAVTSVGPVQFAGLGPSETVARNNALSLAAESAAQYLVDEMNRRGVQ